jgi:3-hydroxyacyl-[acyl-carrier-protein] dehydratase|tara:strand:+ start:5292 stop:5741 length:450 start_codon:yes stop_codon:yes gene_type:complete
MQEIKKKLDIQEILEILPHRYPLLLVDKIIEANKEKVVGIKNVTFNEPHFMGHFPGRPVMPGVMIIEAMAQTSATLPYLSYDMNLDNKLIYFTTINNVKFKKIVTPGDVLELHIELVKFKKNFWKFSGKAKVDGEVVTEADFSAMIVDR